MTDGRSNESFAAGHRPGGIPVRHESSWAPPRGLASSISRFFVTVVRSPSGDQPDLRTEWARRVDPREVLERETRFELATCSLEGVRVPLLWRGASLPSQFCPVLAGIWPSYPPIRCIVAGEARGCPWVRDARLTEASPDRRSRHDREGRPRVETSTSKGPPSTRKRGPDSARLVQDRDLVARSRIQQTARGMWRR